MALIACLFSVLTRRWAEFKLKAGLGTPDRPAAGNVFAWVKNASIYHRSRACRSILAAVRGVEEMNFQADFYSTGARARSMKSCAQLLDRTILRSAQNDNHDAMNALLRRRLSFKRFSI
jgi:hypothetical protein